MLTAIALLVVPSLSPVPKAFLSTALKPMLPIECLANEPRFTVTRGSSWKKGGLVRLNFYYRFDKGEGPSFETILAERGFLQQHFGFGPSPGIRAVRDANGIRQVVGVTTLEAGTVWRWAGITGPANVVTVSEFPLTDSIPKNWHREAILQKPPLPLTYPPDFRFAKEAEIQGVVSEPLIPRSFRSTFWTQVVSSLKGTRDSVVSRVLTELDERTWKIRHTEKSFRAECIDRKLGLLSLEVGPTLDPKTPRERTEVRFNYTFLDQDNRPRIVD